MGWKDFKVAEALDKLKAQERRQIEESYHLLFSTDLGQVVLKDLMQEAIEKSDLPEKMVDGAAMSTWLAIRTGERNLFRYIKAMIKRGQKHT